MQCGRDGAVSATGRISFAPGDEELAATGAASRIQAAAHSPDGQKTQKHEMNKGNEQLLGESLHFLRGHTTRESDAALLHERSPFAKAHRASAEHQRQGRSGDDARQARKAQSKRVAFHTSRQATVARSPDAHDGRAAPFRERCPQCDPSSRHPGR